MPSVPIGEALLERKLINELQLRWALEMHRRTGERLGRVLLAAGLVRRQKLYEVLADLWDCDFVDLVAAAPDAELASQFDRMQMAGEGWMPFRLNGNHLRVATSEPPSRELRARVLAACPAGIREGIRSVEFIATTDWDVHFALRRIFRSHISHDAVFGLPEMDRSLSALGGLTPRQRVSLLTLIVAVIAGAFINVGAVLAVLIVLISSTFVLTILFKLVTSLVGAGAARNRDRQPAPARLPDSQLPVFTVLVPVYQEATLIGGLIEHLRCLDYPQEKLEILLLMEEDDEETIAAAKRADPPDTFRFVLIPAGEPRTKPRACNVGLSFARGEYLVIYDAEDWPDPDQLRDAVNAFESGPETLVCVQARLNYFNANENFLTRLFTLEYSYWFDYMLPGLDRLKLPIPLGGTSNHFRVDRLRELGGWDAFNVTEDADLGVRAAARGYTVGVIDSTTYEEACAHYRPWIRQRTRWIKGYMQTAIVHSRRPLSFTRSTSLRGLFGFVLLIAGTPATFLAVPLLWAVSLLSLIGLTVGTGIPHFFPQPFYFFCEISFFVGNGTMILLNAMAVARRRAYSLLPWALLAPVYWILHSIAAYRALYQLVVKPSLWEKTPHGLTVTATPSLRRAAPAWLQHKEL